MPRAYGRKAAQRPSTLPGSLTCVHACAQSPLSLSLERLASRYALGDASFAECIDFDPEAPARVHLIPRDRSAGAGGGGGGERPGGKGALIPGRGGGEKECER
eukprot:351073-Chlamydomonas_euryale.AAC.1